MGGMQAVFSFRASPDRSATSVEHMNSRSQPDSPDALLRFQCPLCAKRLKVQSKLAGKKLKCPKCAQQILVPFEFPQQPAVDSTREIKTDGVLGNTRPLNADPDRAQTAGRVSPQDANDLSSESTPNIAPNSDADLFDFDDDGDPDTGDLAEQGSLDLLNGISVEELLSAAADARSSDGVSSEDATSDVEQSDDQVSQDLLIDTERAAGIDRDDFENEEVRLSAERNHSPKDEPQPSHGLFDASPDDFGTLFEDQTSEPKANHRKSDRTSASKLATTKTSQPLKQSDASQDELESSPPELTIENSELGGEHHLPPDDELRLAPEEVPSKGQGTKSKKNRAVNPVVVPGETDTSLQENSEEDELRLSPIEDSIKPAPNPLQLDALHQWEVVEESESDSSKKATRDSVERPTEQKTPRDRAINRPSSTSKEKPIRAKASPEEQEEDWDALTSIPMDLAPDNQQSGNGSQKVLDDALGTELDADGYGLTSELDSQAEPTGPREYRVVCPVCTTAQYISLGAQNSKIKCPDCFTTFKSPKVSKQWLKEQRALAKKKQALAMQKPSPTFGNLDPLPEKRKPDEKVRSKDVEERLAKAAGELEDEEQELTSGQYDWDNASWLKQTFALFGDPVLAGLTLFASLALAVVLFLARMSYDVAVDNGAEVMALLAMATVIVLFGGPILLGILANGLAVIQAAANHETRVREWPLFDLFNHFGEVLIIGMAFALAAAPGSIIAVLLGEGENKLFSSAFLLFSIWACFPVFLMSCLENGTLFGVFSKPVYASLTKHKDAWAGLYFFMAVWSVGLFFLFAFLSFLGPIGWGIFGIVIPPTLILLLIQIGLVASRIDNELSFEVVSDPQDDNSEGDDEP